MMEYILSFGCKIDRSIKQKDYISQRLIGTMTHPKTVKDYNGTLEELAQAIGNMTYDQTAVFLEKLAADLKRQSDADAARGRPQLAAKLYGAAESLYAAREDMAAAWKICAPYMKDS